MKGRGKKLCINANCAEIENISLNTIVLKLKSHLMKQLANTPGHMTHLLLVQKLYAEYAKQLLAMVTFWTGTATFQFKLIKLNRSLKD